MTVKIHQRLSTKHTSNPTEVRDENPLPAQLGLHIIFRHSLALFVNILLLMHLPTGAG